MSLYFTPLTREETLNQYPQYYRDDMTCFLIVKEGASAGAASAGAAPAGLYGLIDHGIDLVTKARQAEAFLTIFPAFRYQILGKRFFLALFDHASSSGFDKVYTWTRLASWQKLFQRFEPFGIHRLDTPPPWSLDSLDCNPQDSDLQGSDLQDSDSTKVWFVKEKDFKKESTENLERGGSDVFWRP